jgi:hypothetical protein
MAELDELENELSALRRELAVMSKEGCTPTQFLRLQRELVRAWAAIEECKSGRTGLRLGGEAPPDAAVQKGSGRNRG